MDNLSALGELDEMAESFQFSGGVPIGKRGAKFTAPPGVADNILRAARHVERAKPERPQAEAPAAPQPPLVETCKPASLGRVISDYRTLVETCRQRADELALSRSEIDRLGGLPLGYAGKLLGKESVEHRGKKCKKMWPVSLELMLAVLGLKLLAIEDDAATARTLALRTPVKQNQQRFGNVSRMSANLLPPPKAKRPPTLSLVVQSRKKRRAGKYG
jgi:hypothetical protein